MSSSVLTSSSISLVKGMQPIKFYLKYSAYQIVLTPIEQLSKCICAHEIMVGPGQIDLLHSGLNDVSATLMPRG